MHHFHISGDVGGFMGLLLGASIISVMEILDHFILRWIWKKMDSDRPPKTDESDKDDIQEADVA